MAFDFSTLEPHILQILSAPGTDLATISAKRVRRQLPDFDPSLTAEFLKENKDDVDVVIGKVFEQVSGDLGVDDVEESASEEKPSSQRKRNQEETEYEEEIPDEADEETPPPKKAKKIKKNGHELTDAELARKLSSEINSRSLRAVGKGRGSSAGGGKRASRAKKSAATIDSDGSDDDAGNKKKARRKSSSGGGAAKGGFAKEYTLSGPLAAILEVEKLSRPQVVKKLWVYIKGNELQNPSNKREIMCDGNLKAVFGVDKIDMFKMNKVLGEHLHEE